MDIGISLNNRNKYMNTDQRNRKILFAVCRCNGKARLTRVCV